MTQAVDRGPVEPEHQYPDAPETRRMIYIAVGLVLLILLIVGVVLNNSVERNAEVDAKADQFIAELTAAGLPVPSRQMVVNVLGDDGGAVCTNPNSYLKQALARNSITNGAAGPGIRPVLGPREVVQAEALAIKVYCPDQFPEFEQFVNSHEYADVIKE